MQKLKDDLRTFVGFDAKSGTSTVPGENYIEFINMSLAALGEPIFGKPEDFKVLTLGQSLMAHYQAKDELRPALRPPIDQRIENFIRDYLSDTPDAPEIRLPGKTFNLTRHGLARVLSLPPDRDEFESEIGKSYRVAQGVLHNPRHDRRTTKGVFHVAEGGLPIPADKKAVPKNVFARVLEVALQPPDSLMELPFTDSQDRKARLWVSLMLRPVVCPEIPGFISEKTMETRFFVPGNLVSNLDFVESIFGNAGDPYLRENDAGLDVKHWSGHTGCVILAPHLNKLTKKDAGLPHISEATERQKRDGMCWEKEDELYNDGTAFKLTARDERGVVVTVIADNYFGYCKKEVKTQLGYAANLMGLAEEEHAGGTVAFPSYDLGEDFRLHDILPDDTHSFADMLAKFGHRMNQMPEGYAVDKEWPDIIYVPAKAYFNLPEQRISWENGKGEHTLKLLAGKTYVLPSGYRVELTKPAEGRRWRLIGTHSEGIVCHKPCTVSGGGKSEIAKSIGDAIIHAPFYIQDLQEDLARANDIIQRDYSSRFKDSKRNGKDKRPILSPERSLGSVIKLLTPSEEYSEEHNEFIRAIPTNIKDIILLVKRFYKTDWGDNWRERFTVDIINGDQGHELKYRNNKVITSYLRVGYDRSGSWRVFTLRKDFSPARKLQMEDDITASVVVPKKRVKGLGFDVAQSSVKFVHNCEYRLFQRPDDAIVRGYDKKTEWDLAQPSNFLSNYQPLTYDEVKEMIDDAVRFDYFTDPMKGLIRNFVEKPSENPDYLVSSANPRLVDGKPSKNPRYLQVRLDLEQPRETYLANLSARLNRGIGDSEAVLYPVGAILPGRRNNPPEGQVRALAVHNPIHYLPLAEAFIEFITSITGKSPSTTGAGSEGALTKGPFNALLPITDLNNALVAFMVTGYEPFITAAGYVGPKFRVDHDISLLIPEIWCRMRPEERDPKWLVEKGFMERVEDFEHEGKNVPCHLLGYRINQEFVNHFLGRIFSDPSALFGEDMLKPELQDLDIFVDGLRNMAETHKRAAGFYFEDGSIDRACPPLKALLHIMRDGNYNGASLSDDAVRDLFKLENVKKEKWFTDRFDNLRDSTLKSLRRVLDYVENHGKDYPGRSERMQYLRDQIAFTESPAFLEFVEGTIGRDDVR